MKPVQSIRLWQRVGEFYRRRLCESPGVGELLSILNIRDSLLLEHFQAGFSDGTVRQLLPKGGEVIEALRDKGLLNAGGEETLHGYLVLPIAGADGSIRGFCGLKPSVGSQPEEILVPAGVEGLIRGTLARDGSPLFVTGCVLDALALWQAGFKNTVASVGGCREGSDLKRLIADTRCSEICLCHRRGDSDKARSLHQVLAQSRCTVILVTWPTEISGAVEFFQQHTPEDFKALLSKVVAPSQVIPEPAPHSVHETPERMEACFDGRLYELRAIQKPGPGRLRATVRAAGPNGRFVTESLDLYQARSRRGFLSEAARLLQQPLEVLEEDLRRLADEVEHYVQRRSQTKSLTPGILDETDRVEGRKLGGTRDLVGEIVRDMRHLGMIGEEANKLLGYLVMTSRKLPEPLALLILSGSGAGKSQLQDTVLALCPDEDLVKLTSLTDQALFYRGENSLRHKVLALEELAGAKGANYAIRNLISARKLVIETTVKNALTGKLETQINTVHGPTAVFQTTTDPHSDPETRSRFIVVSVDESPDQTRAILQRQRQAHTLEGFRQRQVRERVLRRHHAFQRLLHPLPVINPFEPLLSYSDDQLLVRRDHPKYLQLILAVAFLHQMQRPLRHDPELGNYIEVTLDDIAIANHLAQQAFGNSLADLSQPGRELLSRIEQFARQKAATATADKDTFTRRELREAIHWRDTRLRLHLRELLELEYIAALSGRFGVSYRYRLIGNCSQETGRCFAGLKSVEQVRREAHLAGIPCHSAPTLQERKCEVSTALKPDHAGACESESLASHTCSGENIFAPPNGCEDR
jgi:hypothetical protein